jgi:stage III sporulation protein AB
MVGNGLGYLDLNMQIENLNLAMLQTEEALKIAKEVQKVRGKLYQTLGVTAGMFLTLLII